MKLTKKIVSLIMAIVIGLTACLPAFAATTEIQGTRPQLYSISEYKKMLWENGYPVFTTQQFLQISRALTMVIRFVTGRCLVPPEYCDVVVDEFVTAACDHILENSGLDIVSLFKSIPSMNEPAELIVETFEVDTTAFREHMYDKRDEYHQQGNSTMEKLCHFIGVYISVVETYTIYAVPTDTENLYQVRMEITFKDGTKEDFNPGIYINSETGWCGKTDGRGLMGIGFDFNLNEMMVYATLDCWMRDFGFCVMYDIAANSMPLLWHYVTRRFKFDYNGLEWMIQIWKGNYLITNGGEVGVYNRAPGSFGTFYECATDDQLLEMSLQIYHGEDLLVNQEPQMHWWVNGFQMSDRMYIPDSLTMKFTIVMPDEEMLNAFCKAIDENYRHDVTYTVEGLKVSAVW